MKKLALLVASVCYCGFSPFAPGTLASALAAVTLFYLPKVAIYLTPIIFILGFVATQKVLEKTSEQDPSFIVIDEWAGMWVALSFVPKTAAVYLLTFLLFRFLDITKPFPINLMERIGGALGVMLDDLVAGVIAGIGVGFVAQTLVFALK